jgi:hypothetical protein
MWLGNVINDDREARRTATQNLQPERALLAAIIERALLDLSKTDLAGRGDCRNAQMWLFAKDDIDQPWSLSWVCECLGMQAAHIRKAAQKILDGQIVMTGNRNRHRVVTLAKRPVTQKEIAAAMNSRLH